MPTQSTQYMSNTRQRPGNNNASYGGVGRDDGINIQESSRSADRSSRPAMSAAGPQGTSRPEMKGPSDIDDILSGLKTKTKTINIQGKSSGAADNGESPDPQLNENSTISITDLKELQKDSALPKKSKRRQGSSKNTISLDI